jgi:hypothetical protein
MKTVTKTYKVYTFPELSKDAKEKALNKWNENNDFPFLEEYLHDQCEELLKQNKIKGDLTAVSYSLSYCQGDGAMFEGTFEWEKYTAVIKHSGHYYHYNSKTIELIGENEHGTFDADEETYTQFDELYVTICKKLADTGYKEIEYQQSAEVFAETCEANGYNFLSDGTMVNY